MTALAATSVVSVAAVTKLAPDDRRRLLEAHDVRLLRTMRQIPEKVVRACASVSASRDFRLADAGRPFEATDVIRKESLPRKRLIWAALLPGYAIVHYESGGYALSYHVLVVSFDPPKTARVVWAAAAWAAGAVPFKDYGEFVAALRSGTLDDTLPYSH